MQSEMDDEWARATDPDGTEAHYDRPMGRSGEPAVWMKELDEFVVETIMACRTIVEDAGEMGVRVIVSIQAPIQGSTFDGAASCADRVETLDRGCTPFRIAEWGTPDGGSGSVTLFEADKR